MADQQDTGEPFDFQDEPYSDSYAAESGLSADDPTTETGLFAEIQPGLNTYDTYDPDSDIGPDPQEVIYSGEPAEAESQYEYASVYEPPVDADQDTPSNPMLAAPSEPEPAVPAAPVAALSVADRGATADLSRPPRAQQFRIQRRSQVSTIIPALVIIAFGVLYLLKPIALSPAITVGVIMAALALSLITRFLLNARRERGLFFIGILLVLWLGEAILSMNGGAELDQSWPLGISAVGMALILTFVFERTHDRGLLLPGTVLIVAGLVGLPFTLGLVTANILPLVAVYWPVVFLLIALALLPRVIRSRTE